MADSTPKEIDDFVFMNDMTKKEIERLIAGNFPSHGTSGILLFGHYGTGKTQLARALPNLIERGRIGNNDEDAYFEFESCGQLNNGPELVRNLQSYADKAPLFNKTGSTYIVLDEVDMLTDKAQESLKAIMSGCGHIVWLLTTNNIGRIDRGVMDRCHAFEFNAASNERWVPRCSRYLASLGVNVSDDKILSVLHAIPKHEQGSARKIFDYMDRLAEVKKRKAA